MRNTPHYNYNRKLQNLIMQPNTYAVKKINPLKHPVKITSNFLNKWISFYVNNFRLPVDGEALKIYTIMK